jgi:virulence-associated protein VagC
MFTTRVFSDEAGHFVVIPNEIAFDDSEMDLEITRCGDVITIRPVVAARPVTDVTQSPDGERK